MRGLDNLQEILDKLPTDDPACRDAWCGWWERNNGVYQPHTPADHPDHIDGLDDPGKLGS